MLSHIFNKPRMVGIAIHDDEIRMLCLRKYKKTARVENCAVGKVKPDWVQGGRIHNSEKISEVIKDLVKQEGLDQSAAAIAFPMAQVIHKYVGLPAYLTWAECKTEISENLSYYLSANSEELCVDVIPLGQRNDKENEFLLIAARRTMIMDYMTVVAQSGLMLQVIDVDFHAIVRTVCHARFATSTYIVIDVDYSQMKLIFVQQNKIIYHQSCVIDSTQSGQGISFCQQLLFAVQRVKMTNDSFAINTIFISGNKNRVKAIKEVIQKNFETNVDLIDPFHNMKLSSAIPIEAVHASSMLTALGLALR